MFCEKCGAKVQENSSFCEECGTPIITNDIKKVTTKVNNLKINPKNKKTKISKKTEGIIYVLVFICIVGVNLFIFK